MPDDTFSKAMKIAMTPPEKFERNGGTYQPGTTFVRSLGGGAGMQNSTLSISPTELHLRRLALRIDREAVAQLAGCGPEIIRRNERATSLSIYPNHVAAINELERWNKDDAQVLTDAIVTGAEALLMGETPVVWSYGDEPFKTHCPKLFQDLALGISSLYRLAAADAFSQLCEDWRNPVAAEMIPAKFEAFIVEIGAPDTPLVRLKWWRAWSAQYRVLEAT